MVAVCFGQDVLVAVGLGTLTAVLVLRHLLYSKPPTHDTNRRIRSLNSRSAVFGDLFEFGRNGERINEWLKDKCLEFNGQPWRIHLPAMQNLVVITEPELIEEVTITQFDNFQKGDASNIPTEDLFGKSLLTWDGEKWYRQRKAATKFFTAKALRLCMTTHMQRNMDQMYGVIDKHVAMGEQIDLLKLFREFALQTFAGIGLGVDLNVIGSDQGHPMEHAVEDATPVIMKRLRVPQFYWMLQRWLNIGPERIIKKSMGEVRDWLGDVISESLVAAAKRHADGNNKQAVKSVVELFLEQSAEDKEGLRSEDLVDFIITFVLAARSTTALALAWTFLMVVKHPHVAKRLREELTSAFPDGDSMYLTTEHMSKLVYLEATIKETLRLYPAIPLNLKEAKCDTVIGGRLKLKKGEVVAMPLYAMARLPCVWGPDAAEFKPERWIDETTGRLIPVPNTKFTAFGSGPRMCIGMKLAMLELRMVMANLLSRYDFTLAVPNDCSHVVTIELLPTTPITMYAQKKPGNN